MAQKPINTILDLLHKEHENPITELQHWKTPQELMICVMLSAQATDVGVNKVTEALFKKYKSPEKFANADLLELQTYISSINYYKTKAQRIIDSNQFIITEFLGNLPQDINKLILIPGIGRKSANVILQEAFGVSQGIVVDTHVARVSYRLGVTTLADAKDAEKIETQLKEIVPKKDWGFYSSAAVLHGRYVCKAKKPNCKECVLNEICLSAYSV